MATRKRNQAFSLLGSLVVVAIVAAPRDADADADVSDDTAIERCLELWGKHPFATTATNPRPKYRTVNASVRLFGLGAEIEDRTATAAPALVLVKPTVSVMTKSTIRLLNPNGWYCLKSNVTVMAKSVIELGCSSNIADSRAGTAVFGSNDQGTGRGVTVMGKTELRRVDCAPPASPPPISL